MFASCDNSSNSDDESPSPSLPANVGENPIEKTIKLMEEDNKDYYLELRTDGTALYVDDDHDHEDGPVYKFKYTYNADAKKIYIQVEKAAFYNEFSYDDEPSSLMTYDEIVSQINKEYTLDNLKKVMEGAYKDKGDKFSSYEDFEKNWYEEDGFDSLKAWLEYFKQEEKDYYKSVFGIQVTYSYKIDGGKMVLTEKFTGVKNLFNSRCEYYDIASGTGCSIRSSRASFYEYNDGKWVYYYGTLDTDNNTIAFRNEDDGKTVPAKYTENISAETVTVTFKDKDYVCKFEGVNFIQE